MASLFSILLGVVIYGLVAASLVVWAMIAARLKERQQLVPFEPRAPVPWTGFDVTVLLIAFVYAEMCAVSLARYWSDVGSGQLSGVGLAAGGGARLIWLAFTVAYLSSRRDAFLDDLGLQTDKFTGDVRLGVLGFLTAVLPVYGLQWMFTHLFAFESKHPIVTFAGRDASLQSLLLASFVAAVVAPLVEEFLFRVVLQGWLEKKQVQSASPDDAAERRPNLAPAVAVSVLFAAMHMGHGPDPIALFFLSLILGYLYQRTHRIVPSLTVHFCVNSLAVAGLWAQWLAA